MRDLRTSFAVATVLALTFAPGTSAQTRPAASPEIPPPVDSAPLAAIADEVAAGRPAPQDFALTWTRCDAMKAQGSKQLMAFTVTYDPAQVAGRPLTLYWRVVANSGAAPAATVLQGSSAVPAASPATSPARVTRGFIVPAGQYQLIVVAREAAPAGGPAKAAALTQAVTVPDFWNGDLTTSSVILSDRLDPVPTPATRPTALERPYVMGGLELVPAWDAAFTRKSEISPFFLVYNAKLDAANKPDVLIEYRFFGQGPSGEVHANTAEAQTLNARTLPPQFDPATYQLQGGQSFPLTSFTPGRYRLEITITDRVAKTSIVRDIPFSITP